MYQKLLALLCFCCFFPRFIFAQSIPNSDFQNWQPVPCLGQPSMYNGFTEWSAFQTTDSSIWGPLDTSCFDIRNPSFPSFEVQLSQTNPTLPVFLQANLDTTNMVPLDSNSLYRLSFVVYSQLGQPSFLAGTNCPDDLCSGLSIGIEIPDSAGTGRAMRWYAGELVNDGFGLRAEFCFPTERFPNGNFVRQTSWRLAQDGPNTGIVLSNASPYALENFGFATDRISTIQAPGNYVYLGGGCGFCPNVLMMYTAPTYPDAQHLSYVEAFPSPNVAIQQQITVEIPFGNTLNFQPFVELRGGQVVGDTLRHSINLLSNGGTICGYSFVDLLFEHDDLYTYRSGKLDLNGPTACMSFGKGGTLRVDDGATLQFGKPGHGMIALRTGGKIDIGRNAELVIGGSLVFGEYRQEHTAQTFEIHLPRGSKLRFAEGSHLRNFLSAFPDTQLDVYLEGGTLDDAALAPLERALIRRHYATVSAEFEENLDVYENPFSESLAFSFTSKAGIPLSIDLLSIDGRKLRHVQVVTQQGNNTFEWETATIASGVYLLQLTTPDARCTRRVLRR
jgi:hypothetical protein